MFGEILQDTPTNLGVETRPSCGFPQQTSSLSIGPSKDRNVKFCRFTWQMTVLNLSSGCCTVNDLPCGKLT